MSRRNFFKKIKKFLRNFAREKIHPAWLIASFCAGFLIGAGASILPESAIFAQNFWPIFAAIFLILVFASRLKIMIFFALISGIIFGLWRGTFERVNLANYENYIGQNVILRGKISEDPDFDARGNLRFKLVENEIILQKDFENLAQNSNENNEKNSQNSQNSRENPTENYTKNSNNSAKNFAQKIENPENSENNSAISDQYFEKISGQIWVNISAPSEELRRSDKVEISGKLGAGFGVFPATISRGNLENLTRETGVDPARELRDAFGANLRKVISAPAADLGMGILAGQKTALPTEISAAFLAASLTHIVVASGYNLTILIRFARRLFAKISRVAALGFGGLAVFVFASITGFSPSMTRASLVAGISLLAWFYGRKIHPVILILLVSTITILINPTQIWGDAGWYMSFLSFVGVIILAPLLHDFFWGENGENDKNPREKIKKRKEKFAKFREKIQRKFAEFRAKNQPKNRAENWAKYITYDIKNRAENLENSRENPTKNAKNAKNAKNLCENFNEKSQKSIKNFDENLENSREKLREKTGNFAQNLRQIFIETLSAQILASPIIALFMGNFSPYGIFANLAILWLLPLTMLATFVAGIGAILLPDFLAQIVAFPANFLLNYIIDVAKFVANLPGAQQNLEFSPAVYIIILLLIFAAIIWLKIKTKHSFREENVVK